MTEDLGTPTRPHALTGEQWRFEVRTDDPLSPSPDERWIRSDLDSGDRVATLKCGDGTEIPLFPTGTAEETVREARRFRVGGQTVYAPLAPVDQAAFPARRVQHAGQTHAYHDSVAPAPVIPDGTVDNFEAAIYEDQNKTLSDYYNGDLAEFTRQQSVFFEGEYALKATAGSIPTISSTSGLPRYPATDEKHGIYIQNPSSAGRIYYYWFVQQEGSSLDGYRVGVRPSIGDILLQKANSSSSNVTLDSASATLSSGETYYVETEHTSAGDITVTVFDATGSQIGQLSATDTTYTSGGIGFEAENADAVFDNYEIVSSSGTSSFSVTNWPDGSQFTPDEGDPSLVFDADQSSGYYYQVAIRDSNNNTDIWETNDPTSGWTKTTDNAYSIAFTDVWWDSSASKYRAYTGNPAEEFWSGDTIEGMSFTGSTDTIGGNEAAFFEDNGTWYAVSTGASSWAGPVSNKIKLYEASSWDGPYTELGDLVYREDSDPWGTGDPYMVKNNGTYYLFGDKSSNHPYYYVGLWSSDSLESGTSNWTYEGQVTSTYGGDPQVAYNPDNSEWIMLNEFADPDNSQGVRYRLFSE